LIFPNFFPINILQILAFPSYADAARTSHFPNEEERLRDAASWIDQSHCT